MERISSGQTYFMKRIFPFLWLGIVGAGFIVAILVPTQMQHNPAIHSPPQIFLVFPIVMLVIGFALFRKLLWDLADSVDDARDYLLVRRGSIEQRVMLANVMNVSVSQFTNPQRLTLRLRSAGPLGDEIVFIPKQPGLRLNPFKRNEIAENLMRRVDEARATREPRR